MHNAEYGDLINGNRLRHAFGGGRVMELRVLRTRYETFSSVAQCAKRSKS